MSNVSLRGLKRRLLQEGAAFISFKVVDGGVFQEEQLIEQLEAPGKVKGEKIAVSKSNKKVKIAPRRATSPTSSPT